MMGVFRGATNFTSDLSSWDVSNVNEMSSMFYEAENFNSDLSSWDVSSVTDMSIMFFGAGLSEENQCAIQTSFSSNENWPYNWVCTYEIGDLAQGGIIFYLDETNQHGLVAALEDLTDGGEDDGWPGVEYIGYRWGCVSEDVIGASGTSIGLGYQNTLAIVSDECSTQNNEVITAAQAAFVAEINNYSDWFLPSQGELLEMFNVIGNGGQSENIGGLVGDGWPYWSSTELYENYARSISFNGGSLNLNTSHKDGVYRVRPIRSF